MSEEIKRSGKKSPPDNLFHGGGRRYYLFMNGKPVSPETYEKAWKDWWERTKGERKR